MKTEYGDELMMLKNQTHIYRDWQKSLMLQQSIPVIASYYSSL